MSSAAFAIDSDDLPLTAPVIVARRAGAEEKYRPEYPEQAKALIEKHNYSDRDLALFFDVSPNTILRWKAKHTLFREALRRTTEQSNNIVESRLFDLAQGFERKTIKTFADPNSGKVVFTECFEEVAPNFNAQKFWLVNRKSKDWGDSGNADTANLAAALGQAVAGAFLGALQPAMSANALQPASLIECDASDVQDIPCTEQVADNAVSPCTEK